MLRLLPTNKSLRQSKPRKGIHADYIRSAFGLLQLLFGEQIICGSYQTQKAALGPSQHLPQKSAELHALASEGRQHASDPSNLVPVSDLWRRIQIGTDRN
jgi:hypothetical protein